MTTFEVSALLLSFAADGREVKPEAVVACPHCVAARVKRFLALLPDETDAVHVALDDLSTKSEVFASVQRLMAEKPKVKKSKKVW